MTNAVLQIETAEHIDGNEKLTSNKNACVTWKIDGNAIIIISKNTFNAEQAF